MLLKKLKISFRRFRDSDLQTKARQILLNMSGNPAFAAAVPSLAEFSAAIDAYGQALLNAADRGRILVAEKNKCRQVLEQRMSQLGVYVMYIACGDAALLTGSGFDLVKDKEPVVLVNPGMVTLHSGRSSGELMSVSRSVKRARGYTHQITPEPLTPESVWVSHHSRRCKITFSGLEPGKKYAVRVLVLGSRDQEVCSPVSSRYVQ